jgi:hypothetical protein
MFGLSLPPISSPIVISLELQMVKGNTKRVLWRSWVICSVDFCEVTDYYISSHMFCQELMRSVGSNGS